VDADNEVIVARPIGKGTAADTFALDAGEATVMLGFPTETSSAAGTVATSWVALTYVVASCVVVAPFVH